MGGKFVFYALAGKPGRRHRMRAVAQYADDFGREHILQDLDRLLRIALIARSDDALIQMLPRAIAQCLHIGQERHVLLGHRHSPESGVTREYARPPRSLHIERRKLRPLTAGAGAHWRRGRAAAGWPGRFAPGHDTLGIS